MSTWFEVILTIYGLVYLLILLTNSYALQNDEKPPELTEEMRAKIYS